MVDRKKLEQLFNRYRDQSEPDKIGEYGIVPTYSRTVPTHVSVYRLDL